MREVAELLYKEVTGKRAQFVMRRDTPRRAMYADAVLSIDARSRRVHTSTRVRLGLEKRRGGYVDSESGSDDDSDADSDTNNDGWGRPIFSWGMRARSPILHPAYDVESFNLIVPPLLKTFPNLQSIRFGCDYQIFGDDSWTVVLESSTAPSTPSQPTASPELPLLGHVHLLCTHKYDLSLDPAHEVFWPTPPSDQFSISERFDLSLYVRTHNRVWNPLLDEWLVAIRTSPIMGNIATAVDFNVLPVDLEDITNTIEKQIEHGHADRLRFIYAQEVLDWGVGAFQTFAEVASTSLETLVLNSESYPDDFDAEISFSDLSTLIPIIRASLPSLRTLKFAMEGIEIAEAVCAQALTPETLAGGGHLKSLTITACAYQTTLFSVIRALSPLCTADADIHVDIGLRSENRRWTKEYQNKYHRHLRAQSEQRRYHLSTIDFDSVNVVLPDEVYQLEYTIAGKPKIWPMTKERKQERRAEYYGDGVLKEVDAGTLSPEDGMLKMFKFVGNGYKE